MTSKKSKKAKRSKREADVAPLPAKTKRPSNTALRRAISQALAPKADVPRPEYHVAQPPPGVIPKDTSLSDIHGLAMDYAGYMAMGAFTGYNQWLGFPYLAELAQLPEYRKINSTLADEMTREWLSLTYEGENEGDEEGEQVLEAMNAALRDYDLRGTFRKAFELESQFGRSQIYLDMKIGASEALALTDPTELNAPLFLSPKKIKRGMLNGLRVVEPMWSYPGTYNSTDPLRDDYYRPSMWYVMAKAVDASRLVTIVSNPVPDMLKPAYSFGGVSMSQMVKPYVENWVRTRQSVSDIIHSFSTSGLATDLGAWLSDPSAEEGSADVGLRMNLFNVGRDNKGLLVLDKETEEFFQYNVPLAGLSDLQLQAQEQMASVPSIPLVKLLGRSPTGLNASSDGELQVFYDHLMSRLEFHRPSIKYVIDVIQLSVIGRIDPKLGFKFNPLYQETASEVAAARKIAAETDVILIEGSIITPEESRARISSDPDSPYVGLNVNDLPEPPDADEDETPTTSNATNTDTEDA